LKKKKISVVADSSCLIALSQIGQFKLLKELFNKVFIPEAVYREVVVKGRKETGSKETKEAIRDGWVERISVEDITSVKALSITLGSGESEVIALCKEFNADFALIDEKTARDVAGLMEINTIGTIGIINLAKKKGFNINTKKSLKLLRDKGFRISDKLYKRILAKEKK
jgi:predicted nucleic acid-binding protein